MPPQNAAQVVEDILQRYQERTPRSRQLHLEAKRWLPGGDTRTISHYSPYPAFMDRGEGCFLVDVDGNRYIDFLNNYAALVHGHSHPALLAAAEAQLRRGTMLGTPSELQVKHATLLCQRIPSIERVRYCNSGTEATLMALRAAKAITGKDAIIKIDGGYHGIHDSVTVNSFVGSSAHPLQQEALPPGMPPAELLRGVPVDTLRQVLVVPFNDLGAMKTALEAHGRRVAAVIMEPMLGAGGGITPAQGYLQGVRELTTRHGVLLVFDECVTFRCGWGGLQGTYGVTPDLTTLSKIIGGGFPIGAFGGREELMNHFDPSRPDPIYHSNASIGNNMSMAVGAAALECFGPPELDKLAVLGRRLMDGLNEAARKRGILGRTTGLGSYVHFHWGAGEPRNSREAAQRKRGLAELPMLIQLELINRGIFVSRRSLFCLSTPMAEQETDAFITAFSEALELLKPYIAEKVPHLLG